MEKFQGMKSEMRSKKNNAKISSKENWTPMEDYYDYGA